MFGILKIPLFSLVFPKSSILGARNPVEKIDFKLHRLLIS